MNIPHFSHQWFFVKKILFLHFGQYLIVFIQIGFFFIRDPEPPKTKREFEKDKFIKCAVLKNVFLNFFKKACEISFPFQAF